MEKEILQLVLVEEKGPEVNEVTLCENAFDPAEIVPIILVSKTVRIKKGELYNEQISIKGKKGKAWRNRKRRDRGP